MSRAAVTLIFATTIAACVGTPQQLREAPVTSSSFEIERDYQAVYRSIISRARPCLQSKYAIAHGDLYHDIRAGEIGLANLNMVGHSSILTIDLRAVSDNRTAVTTYVRSAVYEPVLASLPDWAHERNRACPVLPTADGYGLMSR